MTLSFPLFNCGDYTNLRPGRRWRKGFWLECEPQGLSAVIRAEGPNSEENELQIDVYAQKEAFEAWMWLQPLCQQLAKINNTLSLKTEVFVLAENDDEEKWFSLDSVWHWKNCGMPNLGSVTIELKHQTSYQRKRC